MAYLALALVASGLPLPCLFVLIVAVAVTLIDRLESFFRQSPDTWHDGRRLAEIGGCYAWRSRCSDLRKRGLDIRNRMRRCKDKDGQPFVISEYKFVPAAPKDLLEIAEGADRTGATC